METNISVNERLCGWSKSWEKNWIVAFGLSSITPSRLICNVLLFNISISLEEELAAIPMLRDIRKINMMHVLYVLLNLKYQ